LHGSKPLSKREPLGSLVHLGKEPHRFPSAARAWFSSLAYPLDERSPLPVAINAMGNSGAQPR
jgi:hypothetical protein